MTAIPAKSSWRAGVLAAGRGERLCAGGGLKPLVTVAGETLIDRVFKSIGEIHPSEIVVIVNEEGLAVRDHVVARKPASAVTWIIESTPSSMHSFLRVLESLSAEGRTGPFLVSTVDTVAPEGAFQAFVESARTSEADVVLAVTAVAPDDRPLLVRTDGDPIRLVSVSALGDAAAGSRYMTAGYYCVRGSVCREADAARHAGLGSLRAFFEHLLMREYRFDAVLVAPGVDVDRPGDIRAAESLLRQVEA